MYYLNTLRKIRHQIRAAIICAWRVSWTLERYLKWKLNDMCVWSATSSQNISVATISSIRCLPHLWFRAEVSITNQKIYSKMMATFVILDELLIVKESSIEWNLHGSGGQFSNGPLVIFLTLNTSICPSFPSMKFDKMKSFSSIQEYWRSLIKLVWSIELCWGWNTTNLKTHFYVVIVNFINLLFIRNCGRCLQKSKQWTSYSYEKFTYNHGSRKNPWHLNIKARIVHAFNADR